MAGVSSEDSGVGRSTEGISSGQRCLSGEALAEWRSSEQVENGTPSTSPPYWDSDDDDDGGMDLVFLYYYCLLNTYLFVALFCASDCIFFVPILLKIRVQYMWIASN